MKHKYEWLSFFFFVVLINLMSAFFLEKYTNCCHIKLLYEMILLQLYGNILCKLANFIHMLGLWESCSVLLLLSYLELMILHSTHYPSLNCQRIRLNISYFTVILFQFAFSFVCSCFFLKNHCIEFTKKKITQQKTLTEIPKISSQFKKYTISLVSLSILFILSAEQGDPFNGSAT